MTDANWLVTLLAAVALALVHLFAGGVKALHIVPRSRWLSVAGGVSVAYVFIHVLPELSAGQQDVETTGALGFLEHHVYLMALIGLAVFYGLERAARRSRQQQREAGGEDTPSAGVYWLHIGSFALYNALVGYLIVHPDRRCVHRWGDHRRLCALTVAPGRALITLVFFVALQQIEGNVLTVTFAYPTAARLLFTVIHHSRADCLLR